MVTFYPLPSKAHITDLFEKWKYCISYFYVKSGIWYNKPEKRAYDNNYR